MTPTATALFDFWEIQFGFDPFSAEGESGAGGDPDNDGRTNGTEFVALTHPRGLHTRYFAEGATGAFFDTRIALVNPGPTSASVLLRFRTSAAAGVVQFVTVPRQLARDGVARFSQLSRSDDGGAATGDREFSIDDRIRRAHRRRPDDDVERLRIRQSRGDQPAGRVHLVPRRGRHALGIQPVLSDPQPERTATTVQVTYLLPAPTAPIVKSHEVPANSRFNIWVNQEGAPLASTDVSAVITAPTERPIIVERAMYRDAAGQVFGAGHSSGGVTAPSTNWFLAEGATGSYFDMFVLIANPNASDATVTATYLLPSGQTVVKTYNVGARSRFNIWVDLEGAALANTAVSTTLVASVPVIVERSMWWPNGDANWFEAHNSPGATVTGTKWALAEGEVGGARSTETYVLIANTSAWRGPRRSRSCSRTARRPPTHSRWRPAAASTSTCGPSFPQAVGKRFGVIVESVGVRRRKSSSNARCTQTPMASSGRPAPMPSRHDCSEAGRARSPARAARAPPLPSNPRSDCVLLGSLCFLFPASSSVLSPLSSPPSSLLRPPSWWGPS